MCKCYHTILSLEGDSSYGVPSRFSRLQCVQCTTCPSFLKSARTSNEPEFTVIRKLNKNIVQFDSNYNYMVSSSFLSISLEDFFFSNYKTLQFAYFIPYTY